MVSAPAAVILKIEPQPKPHQIGVLHASIAKLLGTWAIRKACGVSLGAIGFRRSPQQLINLGQIEPRLSFIGSELNRLLLDLGSAVIVAESPPGFSAPRRHFVGKGVPARVFLAGPWGGALRFVKRLQGVFRTTDAQRIVAQLQQLQ